LHLVKKRFEKFITENIEKHKLKEVVLQLATTTHGEKQKTAIDIIKDVPVDDVAKEELRKIGIKSKEGMTVGNVMAAATAKDIRMELKQRGVAPSEVGDYNVSNIKKIRMIEPWQWKTLPNLDYVGNIKKEVLDKIHKITGIAKIKI
jgi:hypothetical protein